MIPSAAYELLANDSELIALGITPTRIKELQSVDERPFDSGYFVIFNWEEETPFRNLKGPRTLTIWVHTPMDRSRSYLPIVRILNRINTIFSGVEHVTGADGIRMTCLRRTGGSGNLVDAGWKTIARNVTYGVLYDETAA